MKKHISRNKRSKKVNYEYRIIVKKMDELTESDTSPKSRRKIIKRTKKNFKEFVKEINKNFPKIQILNEYPIINGLYARIPKNIFSKIVKELEKNGCVLMEDQPIWKINRY